jgi:hypothetical protein
LPEERSTFEALPDALDRKAVERAVHDLPTTEAGAKSAFVAVMAWGYGNNGYGPARAARVPDGTARALILDVLIGGWLRANTPLNPVTARWAPSSYERYLACMREWAEASGVDAATLEAILLTEQADIGGGQWAGSNSAQTLRLGFRGNQRSERGTMADAITTARAAIESRIREIEQEVKRLRGALAELVEGGERAAARRRGSGARRSAARRRRKMAPRGQRREQLLAHLERNPGAKPAEIAKAIGTTPANVQNVLRKARQDKVVRRRRGGGYALAKRAGSRSPAPAAASR